MAIREWWRQVADETYWLEITDRPDIGSDLKAPQRQDDGIEFWGYSLVTHTNHGEIVFHYDKRRHAITAWSRIAGGWWEEDIVWAAHGTSARGASVLPYRRPGWKVGLTDHELLTEALTLQAIRTRRNDVLALEAALQDLFGVPLYLAFTRYGDTLRPQQGYLAKLPRDFVEMFPQLAAAAQRAAATAGSSRSGMADHRGVGTSYQLANEEMAISNRDPMFPDPALIERGNRGHATAQNQLAARLVALGLVPLSPCPGEPAYDLAWMHAGQLWVTEVKSLTDANEERQLRLALGQVLRYADLLSGSRRVVHPVVMAERQPSDPGWQQLHERLGVLTLWPERLEELPMLLNRSDGPAVASEPARGGNEPRRGKGGNTRGYGKEPA